MCLRSVQVDTDLNNHTYLFFNIFRCKETRFRLMIEGNPIPVYESKSTGTLIFLLKAAGSRRV